MNHFFVAVLVALFLFVPSIQADVKEAKRMAEILPYVDSETLLVFDIDNTLIEPVQTFGSDQWFRYAIKKYQAQLEKNGDKNAKEHAVTLALATLKKTFAVTDTKAVEPGTPELVHHQQQKGIYTMGLTARPTDTINDTFKQLEKVGIDLGKKKLTKDVVLITNEKDVNFSAKFQRGVLFTGENPKGNLLLPFLRRKDLSFHPKKIVFVDDRQSNIDSVEKTLQGSEFQHISFRYGAADERVTGLNRNIAEVQWQFFEKILSDKAAEAILVFGAFKGAE